MNSDSKNTAYLLKTDILVNVHKDDYMSMKLTHGKIHVFLQSQ